MITVKNDRAVLTVNSGVTFLAAEMGDRSRMGIHLLTPTQTELEKALDRALESGHRFIWIHDSVETYEKREGK